MEITIVTEGGQTSLRLKGRFDFSAHRDFRAAIDNVVQAPSSSRIVVDLGGVEYIDSSALGMLLILRDKAQTARKALELAQPRGSVAQVLEIANFKNLFAIR